MGHILCAHQFLLFSDLLQVVRQKRAVCLDRCSYCDRQHSSSENNRDVRHRDDVREYDVCEPLFD
ncbi:hypothetical protein D3C74_392310 [compost metagenome]